MLLKEETLFTRTFTRRVGHAVEVDTQCDTSNSSLPIRDPETETCEEQKKRHDWESDQEQRSTAKLVDGKHTGNGEKSIDETETERSKEGGDLGKTSRSEDGSSVVNNSVDTTLLSDISLPQISLTYPQNCCPNMTMVEPIIARLLRPTEKSSEKRFRPRTIAASSSSRTKM